MEEYVYYIYIMSNKTNTTLYVGVTGNLYGRVLYHQTMVNKNSFTSRYKIFKLVYYEEYNDINEAIAREKQIKGGSRQDKIQLISKSNPKWTDLSADWFNNSKKQNYLSLRGAKP